MPNVEFTLPDIKISWHWYDVNFDLEKAIDHLNEYFAQFYENQEKIYVKSFLTFCLKSKIAGIQIMSGGKRVIYLIFLYNDIREQKMFYELIRSLNDEWNRTFDIERTDAIIKNSYFGKRWYGRIDLQPLKHLEIFSRSQEVKEITEKIKKYFCSIGFKTTIYGYN